MNILVCNAGSTSLKFKLYSFPGKDVLASGKCERVGSVSDAIYTFNGETAEGQSIKDYRAGIERFLDDLGDVKIDAVGFKTVLSKGFYGVHLIDSAVIKGMEDFLAVAPAHNTAYIQAVRAFMDAMPGVPLVGSFETAFHTTIPMAHRVYGIPWELTERYEIYKMGYHGASHSYIASKLSEYRRVISCHLGGSGSICAILDGKSIDNSFGLSLQAGVLNANRAGDIDPYIIPYLLKEGLTLYEVTDALDKNGGLEGISGVSGDMRILREAADAGNGRARLALDVYVYGIVKYIGAYHALLGGLDAIAFTAGIGEHDSRLRADVLGKVSHLGVKLDEARNKNDEYIISTDDSPVKAFVIPADEEAGVALNTYKLLIGKE